MKYKKIQQEAAKVEAKKTKAAKEPKEKSAPKEFMPVIFDSKPDKFPVSAISEVKLAKPVKIDDMEYVAITLGDSTYYVKPSIFQRYVLDRNLTPENTQKIRNEAKESVQEVKKAWVKLGTAVLSVHTPRLYLAWGHKTFDEYCENELKLHFTTIYQIMTSTLFLMRDQPEIYQSLMDGEKKVYETLPSYHSIYLLEKKRKRLQEKNKYEELREQLLKHGLTTRNLAKKLHEIFDDGKAKVSLKTLVKNYAVLCEQMQKLKLEQKVVKEAREVLEKLRKMEGEKL